MTGSRSLEPSPAQESETGASGGSGKAFPSRPFIAIAQVINDFVTGLQRTVHDDDLWAVRARLKQGAMIDHDRDAVAFSCAFLTANYWKAAHALMAVRPDPVRRIVDLGSGSGAMALATLAYLWQLDDAAPQRVHLRLVDRSRQQLMIAQQVLEQVRRELKGLDVEVSLEPHDVRDLGPSLQHDRADLVTASHLFTENREHVGWLAERAVESVAASGTLIMIEPHDDAVWSNLLQYVRGSALPSQNGHAVITPGMEAAMAGAPTARLSLPPRTGARLLQLLEIRLQGRTRQGLPARSRILLRSIPEDPERPRSGQAVLGRLRPDAGEEDLGDLDARIAAVTEWIYEAGAALLTLYDQRLHRFIRDTRGDEPGPTSTSRAFLAIVELLRVLAEEDGVRSLGAVQPGRPFQKPGLRRDHGQLAEDALAVIRDLATGFFGQLPQQRDNVRLSRDNDLNMFTDVHLLLAVAVLDTLLGGWECESLGALNLGIEPPAMAAIRAVAKELATGIENDVRRWGGGKVHPDDKPHDFITFSAVRALDAVSWRLMEGRLPDWSRRSPPGETKAEEPAHRNDSQQLRAHEGSQGLALRVSADVLRQLGYDSAGITSRIDPGELVFGLAMLERL